MPCMMVMRQPGIEAATASVLAGEQRYAAFTRIDALHVLARVPVEAVVVHVARVDARPALAVIPPVLALRFLWALRRAQPVRVARAQLTAVDRRMVEEVVVAP